MIRDDDSPLIGWCKMLHVPAHISHDTLLPTLNSTMNVVESSKSHQVKKSYITKSVTFNNESPVSKTDSYLSVSEEESRRLNDSEPIKIASQRTEEIHKIDGKLSDHSSRSFTTGSLDVSEHTRASKQNGVTCLKPARKQTAPRFLSTLSGAIVDANKDVKFEAIVESYPAADIVWCKNDSVLTNKPNKIRITWELNRAKLEIFNVKSEDAGRYTCSASNDAGSASASADLFVKKTAFPPVISKRLHPQSITVGKRVVFEIEVTGTPRPIVYWFKDDLQLAKTSSIYRQREQGNSHALIFEKVRLEDSGQYKVKAQNEAGETVSLATLHVFEPPTSTITDENHKLFLTSNMESISNGAEPTSNLRENSDYCKMNSSLTNGEFSQSVEITKTDKRASFLDGQKVQDDFNTSIEKYNYNDPKTIKYSTLPNTASDAYENNSDSFARITEYKANYNSKEIEILQKPLLYTDLNTFQGYSNATLSNDHHILLKPGPPPEMGYIPKESVPKARDGMADRVKKLESSQRQLSPVEIPPGAVKIFPTITPKRKETENIHRTQYSSCIKEYKDTVQNHTMYENDEQLPSIHLFDNAPNIKLSKIENDRWNETENRVPIYRPQADVELRPLSPRPSAEGVSMERLWTHKRNIEQSFARPSTPHSFSTLGEDSSFTSIPVSSFPSTEGVATEKLWSCVREKHNRPHSVIGLPELSSLKTGESINSENFQCVTWGSGSDAPKTETSHKYENIHKINDQVLSKNVLNQNVSDFDSKNYMSNQSYSEVKGVKKVGNKFQWPPKEGATLRENSLHRRSYLQNRQPVISTPEPNLESETGYAAQEKSSYIQQSKQVFNESQKRVYGETHSEPMSSTKVSNQNYDIIGNQTLPRSFKFTSSNDSKFKPVKPFSPLAPERTTPYSQPELPSQSSFQSSSFPTEAESARTSESFGSSTSALSKSVTPRPRVCYTSDTEDSWKNAGLRTRSSAEENRTQTTLKISDDKISNIFSDNTKLSSSQLSSSSFTTVPSLPSKCDSQYKHRENVYNYRLPRIWHPSDASIPDNFYSHRPVRPNLTSAQTPLYNRSSSAEVASEFKHTESSQCNFQPVSPVAQYSNAPVKLRASPPFSSLNAVVTDLVNDRQYTRSVSNEGSTARSPISETYQHQVWQKPTNYETSEDQVQSTPEITNLSDLKKIHKVGQIRKQFEGDSALSRKAVSMVAPLISCKGYQGITSSFSTSSHKTISQQFSENVVHNVSSKQNELKQTPLKSPSLGSSSVGNEHHLFKENYNTDEHESTNDEFGWKSDLTRSTEADYVIVNGDGISEQESRSDSVPVFSTPLHDIAAVCGSKAKFECIVQSESPFEAIWQKDGDVLQNSELCHINCRNGVCTLVLLKTYMYDAGTYHCIATNEAGAAETSASLTVSNERRSYCNLRSK